MKFFEIVNSSPYPAENVLAVFHEKELTRAWLMGSQSTGTELRVYRTDNPYLKAITDEDEFRSVIKAGGYTDLDGTFIAICDCYICDCYISENYGRTWEYTCSENGYEDYEDDDE